MPVKGGYLLAAGGGALLLWAGFRGKKWTDALRAIAKGQDPRATLNSYPITTSSAAFNTNPSSSGVAASGALTQTGEAISSDAMQYVGAKYVWAGAPGPYGVGPWDCSSFCNAVIGRDLHLAIPMYKPGTYHGQTHGPATGIWLVWTGAFTIRKQDTAPGDLCVWQTHMGIAISGDQYISAYDTQEGVTVKTIHGGGPVGEVVFIRRLKAVTVRG